MNFSGNQSSNFYFGPLCTRNVGGLLRPFSKIRKFKSRLNLIYNSITGNELEIRCENAKITANAQRITLFQAQSVISNIPRTPTRVHFDPKDLQMNEASIGTAESLRTILNQTKSVDLQNGWDETALHVSLRSGNFDTLQFLLNKANADPNIESHDHWTPLHFAAFKGDLEACRMLIENGAGPLYRTITKQCKALNLVSHHSIDFHECRRYLREVEELMRNDLSIDLFINKNITNDEGQLILRKGDKVRLAEKPPEDLYELSFCADSRITILRERRLSDGTGKPNYKLWQVVIPETNRVEKVMCHYLSIRKPKDPSIFPLNSEIIEENQENVTENADL